MVRAGVFVLLAAVLSSRASAEESDAAAIDRCEAVLRTSQDPVARFDAVRTLGRCAADVAARLHRVATRDADWRLRAEAARALGTTADPAAPDALVELVAGGGVLGVRRAVAEALARQKVPASKLVAQIRSVRRKRCERVLLVEALGRLPDLVAAAHLDGLAQSKDGAVRAAALAALRDHVAAGEVAPDLVDRTLASATDVDTLVAALGLAERFGDERVRAHEVRLRMLRDPFVSAALDAALTHLAWRTSSPARRAAEPPTRTRDAVDRVHVFHEGPRVSTVWARVLEDLDTSRPRYEDVRVALVFFRDPSAARRRSYVDVVPFTRDEREIEATFTSMDPQVGNSQGVCVARALEEALERVAWREGGERSVTLHGDVEPRDYRRAARAVAMHVSADATPTYVHLFSPKPDVPDLLRKLAGLSRRAPIVPPPPSRPATEPQRSGVGPGNGR